MLQQAKAQTKTLEAIMYEEEFIRVLVNNAAGKIKKNRYKNWLSSFDKSFKAEEYYKKLPEFNEMYVESLRQHYKVAVHAEDNCFPYEILKNKAPNQSPEEWEYQMGLYECYTKSTWDRAKGKTKIVSNAQNFSITNWDDEQKKYFYTDYPNYHSVLSYFFDIVRDKKIDYPNQVLLIKPKEIPGEYDNEGNFKPDQSKEIEPIACIIEEQKVVDFRQNDYLLIITEMDVTYKYGDTVKNDGLSFEFYDKNNIWKIIQTGVKDDQPYFDIKIIYEHGWDYLPAQKLKGTPIKSENGNTLYGSSYSGAIPDLNEVIRMSSILMMGTYSTAYSIPIVVVDECRYKDATTGSACNSGVISINGVNSSCPACKGTGKMNHFSPTGRYEIPATVGIGQENNLPMTPPIQYAAPDGQILDHLDKRIELKKRESFSFLFEAEEAKSNTATGAWLEKEEFHSFMLHFSAELFDLLDFTIEAIGFYRWGDSFKKPSISPPQYFNFRTSDGITTEISGAKKDALPSSYTKGLVLEGAQTRFNGTHIPSEVEFSMKIDKYWNLSSIEINAMLDRTITKIDAVIHNCLSTFILLAQQEHEDFWTKDFKIQQEIILGYAQIEVDKLKLEAPSLAADVMAGVDGGGAEPDALEEAKARLKGSVGGVQGLLETQAAVAAGTTDYNAAVTLLVEIYGFDQGIAKRLLGPKVTKKPVVPIPIVK